MAESSSSRSPSTSNVDSSFEGSEQSEKDDMQSITMLDVLKEEQELEADAKAVLGASDDKNCTYPKGYVKRQAVYACMTCSRCSEDNFKPSGICLACSYHCHEGHELVELYTKRNFRCDCGNSKFPGNKCNLEPCKEEMNENNRYNQNFEGVYCLCKRPYPDPEDSTGDSMIQCIVCEDWFHERHLGKSVPAEEYDEMICAQCMNLQPFLACYAVSGSIQPVSGCVLKAVQLEDTEPGTSFFSQGWRKKLCTCESCMKLYESRELCFLLDETDTVHAYEEQGKASVESQYEQGLKALSSMNRVQQVEAIEEYNDMKSQLKEYLQKFADNKKVVKEEDIREFFSGMEARKKQRLQVQVPDFCH